MSGDGSLTPQARADLLALARGTLEAHFRGQPPPRLSSDRAETFGQPRGLFVTLHRGGQLRGCIGTLAPTGDLTRVVSEFALRAALEDPRFPPLAEVELAACAVEISVLTAPRPIEGPGEIEVGRDGLILEVGGRRGLLLPQVATELGLDAERFLAEVSRKAGLPPDAWRRPEARIWAFQAEVFAE
ncbi:MAG TPA: AmmeMemoRadiSam system protein A [Thermoanaerobaculia bacterium]|nr:AmmeMemoRadiSam system protein A [Thermoanaerobaculia bacterium]